MIEKVTKRDKSLELFDFTKVLSAVSKAFESVKENVPKDLEEQLSFVKELDDKLPVETIQDVLEEYLIKHYYRAGKSFMLYRHEHKIIRDSNNKLVKEIAAKLKAENVENQNANVDEYSFGGRVGEASDLVTKKFALDNIVSKMAKRNHEGNMIYIHDLSAYSDGRHNCMSEPIDDLLKNGFSVRQCDIRGAKSVSTALQLVAVLFQVQSLEQFGGVSATHLDWSLVPYLRMSFTKYFKDGIKYLHKGNDRWLREFLSSKKKPDNLTEYQEEYLWDPNVITFEDTVLKEQGYECAWKYAMEQTEKELYQAVEGMYHNLNSLQSRSGQ